MPISKPARGPAFIGAVILSTIVALLLIGLGALLVLDGYALVRLGGSFYYLLAGIGLVVAGLLLAVRRPAAGLVYGVVLLATIAWALFESGLSFWPLLPRIFAPAVVGIFVLVALLGLIKTDGRRLAMLTTGAGVVIGLLLMTFTLVGQFSAGQAKTAKTPVAAAPPPALAQQADWRHWGRDAGGTRFAPYAQITKDNVDKLQVAWTLRTGEVANGGSEDQSTPMQIGDTVYLCTPLNKVIAVDADTGKEKWRNDPKVRPGGWNRCRGIGYYETGSAKPVPTAVTAVATNASPKPAAPGAPAALCARRIINTTIDARLLALDAATGAPCPGFGTGGAVDLKVGQGEIKRGFYFQTSAPTVIGDRVIIGGWVQDNTELGEPSGVVRAFSADTGTLIWAWDLGDPTIDKLPPAGKTYTRGTPNVWSTPAFDDALGLVYVPTGNATPDYWGSHRSPEAEKYSSSVVAIDAATGKERWRFQTVHHDVWDYDVPSQPMLIDFPDGKGGKIPALVQLTKRGQIFVLDRRTGAPITEVVEKAVPQGPQKGEWLSPTQPYSTGMPAINAETLSEKMMWGTTPLDQVKCRIQFRKVRYEGEFTPPGSADKPNLQYPGNGGGQNWGSGSYDAINNRLLVNGVRSPIMVSLVPSKRPTMQLDRVPNRDPRGAAAVPYQSRTPRMESDLGIPCLQPPYGTLTAIDLNTRKVIWQVPTGTARELGPNYGLWWQKMRKGDEPAQPGPAAQTKAAPKAPSAVPPAPGQTPSQANVEQATPPAAARAPAPQPMLSHLPIPVGTLGVGGSTTTAGGLTFHAATQDAFLRAYDTATGKIVWEQELPVGVGGTPMTFVSPRSGRQFVVVSAGGSRNMPRKGDYVIAYALPQEK